MVWDLLEFEELPQEDDLERTVEFINISELDEADEYVAKLTYDFNDADIWHLDNKIIIYFV